LELVVFGDVLPGGEVAEGLVGSDGVEGVFPSEEFGAQGLAVGVGGTELPELFGVGALGALDTAVEFGATRGEDE
jgi:hypothetical protein